MWLILAESDILSDHADGLGSDVQALGFAACYQWDARTRRCPARQDAQQCRDSAAAATHSARGLWRGGRVSGEQGIDLRLHVVIGRNDVEEILDDAKIEIDAEGIGRQCNPTACPHGYHHFF